MSEAVIIEALRTPFGRRGGALREQRPDSLLAQALKGLVQRAGIDPEKIEDVVDGTVTLAVSRAPTPPGWACCWPAFRSKLPACP